MSIMDKMKRMFVGILILCILLGWLFYVYHDENVSEQIHMELNNRKNNDVIKQDTISLFMGKPIVINDKIYEQISAIAAQDKKLSYSNKIIQIVDVRW